jgi:hypothetical protein
MLGRVHQGTFVVTVLTQSFPEFLSLKVAVANSGELKHEFEFQVLKWINGPHALIAHEFFFGWVASV